MLFLFILCIMQIERRLEILRKKVCEAFRKKKLIINYNLAYVKVKFYPAKVFDVITPL